MFSSSDVFKLSCSINGVGTISIKKYFRHPVPPVPMLTYWKGEQQCVYTTSWCDTLPYIRQGACLPYPLPQKTIIYGNAGWSLHLDNFLSFLQNRLHSSVGFFPMKLDIVCMCLLSYQTHTTTFPSKLTTSSEVPRPRFCLSFPVITGQSIWIDCSKSKNLFFF